MFQYPAGMQLAIYKREEEDLLRKLRYHEAIEKASPSKVSVSAAIRWLSEKVLRNQPGKPMTPATARR